MNLTFTGSNTSLTFAHNSVIGGSLTTSTPDLFLNGATFNGTTNELPCGPGLPEGCLATWAPFGTANNQYFVFSDTPEPSTIMLLGSGLFGAFCFVRRRLT